MNGRLFTQDEIDTIVRLYPSRPTPEIAKLLNRDKASIYAKANSLGLRKTQEFLQSDESGRLRKGETRPGSEKGQFKKGNVPYNAGTRRPGWHSGRMKETQFKKGDRNGAAAKNWKPIGTILPDTDGYLRIKVREAEHGKEAFGFGNSKVWPMYSRYVWEQHNNPIPPKHLVVFKDGNRQNCLIENLELISMADNCRRNSMWAVMPRELAEVIQLNGALKRKLRKLNAKEHDHGSQKPPIRDARSVEG